MYYILGLIGILAIINSYSFALMAWDKNRAKGDKRRISERQLLGWAAAGGSLGIYLGMRAFRHKTQKQAFRLPFFTIVALQILSAAFLLYNWLWLKG